MMKQNAKELLAERVKTLRKQRGWSQERLAEESGMHRTYIGCIERAERSCGVEVMDRLAGALDVPLSELVNFSSLGQTKRSDVRGCNAYK